MPNSARGIFIYNVMRLNRYQDFMLESAGKMMIIYSDTFRNLLRSTDSQIGKILLRIESDLDCLDDYTLIDKTDKNDMISYVQASRIYRDNPDLKDMLPNLGPYSNTIRNSKFWTTGRTPQYGIGRWVRHIYKDVIGKALSDSDLEAFVNVYKSTHDRIFSGDGNFELVRGEDIRRWYLVDNYLEESGQLGNSCMRYAKCQGYLDIYVNNPESCQLLILKSDKEPDKITGRALVWKIHKGAGDEGKLFMDRVYTIKDSDRIRFQEYAKKNGMLTTNAGAYKIKVQGGGYDYYPYMDTFSALDRDSGILSTDLSGQSSVELSNTDGTCSDLDGRVWSEYHGEWINEDDARWCADIDGWAHYDSTIWLEYLDEYVTDRADTTYSEWDERSYYSEDTVWSEVMNDALWKEIAISFRINPEGDIDWCTKEEVRYYVKVDGEYYSRTEYVKDPYTGEYAWVDEMKERLGEEFGEWDAKKEDEFKRLLIELEPSRAAIEALASIKRKGRWAGVDWIHLLPALMAHIWLDKGFKMPINCWQIQETGNLKKYVLQCEDFAGEMRFRKEGTLNSDVKEFYSDMARTGRTWDTQAKIAGIKKGVSEFDLSLLPERLYKMILFRSLAV